jgi:transposase-like protein
MERITITHLIEKVPTEAAAYAYLEGLRWPDKPVCPHCGSINDHYFLKPANGTSRKTRTGAISERRVWKCKDCRKQFSVITGTIFHGSKVSLRTWLFVFFEMCANKNGIAAREIERRYGVAPKTAWHMTHRIREAMKSNAPLALMTGTVVADETWIGGEPKFRHAKDRVGSKQGKTDKTAVMTLIDAETGEARSKVVANVSSKNLREVIEKNVEMKKTTLHTDDAPTYKSIGKDMAGHERVNHSAGEYVRGQVSTNKAENFFSQLKRSIDGTHHNVSKVHLPRYLAEFDFRYSTRDMTDTERMTTLMGQTHGKRLTYKRGLA